MTDSDHPLIERWSEFLMRDGKSVATQRRYVEIARSFIQWFDRNNPEPFDPARLTPLDLRTYIRHIETFSQPSTVNVHACALRSLFGWSTSQYYLNRDPSHKLKTPPVPRPLMPRTLSPEQVAALLEAARETRHGTRDYAIVQLMAQTGIRVSECAGLILGDVRMNQHNGQLRVRAPKGKQRIVPLNGSARQALAQHFGPMWGVDSTVAAVAAAWGEQNPGIPLWYSQKGGQLSIRSISDMMEQIVTVCRRAGDMPEDVSPHTLRHTFAANYLRDHPEDLLGLATLLGHSSLESTRIYLQPSYGDLEQRVEETSLNHVES